MSDISLLPESYREQEEQLKKTSSVREEPTGSVSMHIPQAEQEDVEIIEVDESEVEEMLMTEPLYSRVYYKAGVWFDSMREKLFKPQPIEPPSKLPPQFFTPPKEKSLPTVGEKSSVLGGQPASIVSIDQKNPAAITQPGIEKPAISKARIIPSGASPRQKRVRIIKRIRKPVQVSLLDQELMYQIGVDVPKRQYTLAFLLVLFGVAFAAAYLLLDRAQVQAMTENQRVQSEYRGIKAQAAEQQTKWTSFQDLEARLIALNNLMDSHSSMSNALDFLEAHTLPDVYYGNFSIDTAGKVGLAVTAGSLPSAARQIMIFKEAPELLTAEASSFSVSDAKDETGGLVQFQIAIQFKPEALMLKTKLATPVKPPVTSTVPTSTVSSTLVTPMMASSTR